MHRFHSTTATRIVRRIVQSNTSSFSISCIGITSIRNFSQTHTRQLRTSELKPTELTSLKCNASRLWETIHHTAQWGPGHRYGPSEEQTGLSRLTLSTADKHARDWFVSTVKSLNCSVQIDAMGNIFATRPGLNPDAPATFVGSHLDSQPTGGRFDGILGVYAGVEMLKVLDENWIETEGPVGVVNWTNEEGARFPVSMMGSGVWAGVQSLDQAYAVTEVVGVGESKQTVEEALDAIGYKGAVPADFKQGVQIGGHFELHIEQGPILINGGQKVGAVEGSQAYKWFEIVVEGRACHSGTTPFEHRADPLLYTSRMVCEFRAIGEKFGGLATVGIIRAEPGSVNTVPDRVFMTLDLRHKEDPKLEEMIAAVQRFIDSSTKSLAGTASSKIRTQMRPTFHSPATIFDPEAVKCVEESIRDVLKMTTSQTPLRMISGAGHDSVNTAKRTPTAMVFVPCKDGVSHHPEEWCEKEDCAKGTDVLLQSVLRFDRLRHQRGDFD